MSSSDTEKPWQEAPETMEHHGIPGLRPFDVHNRELARHVHPSDWRNPKPEGRYNMVVVGAGTAGLVTAAATAGLGGRVALIERELMGGDCLNVGCVPSKALIRCAKAAAQVRRAAEFGVRVEGSVTVDFGAVMERMRRLRAKMATHDGAQRFTDLGVDVYIGEARFTDARTIAVGDETLTFSRALIATGARATPPPIEGLEDAGYLTNETVFSLTTLPPRLAVIGAGPIGCEMAQTFARLGAEVTLLEATDRILPRDDGDAARIVADALVHDGVRIVCGGKTAAISKDGAEKVLEVACRGERHTLRVDEVLVGVGRSPNVENLGLEAARVAYDPRQGVRVNNFLQTSVPHIYAAGDVASPYKFTHAADAMARIVVQNALFFGRAKTSALTVPWATYTDPEVAHVGLTVEAAEQQGIALDTITVNMGEVDRAILDGAEEGFVRIHLRKGTDRIAGATIVAEHAGDMISELTALMVAGKGLASLAKTIHPYPTQAEALKKAADAYSRTRLTPRIKSIFETLLRWRR